jgi:hypothetical protein
VQIRVIGAAGDAVFVLEVVPGVGSLRVDGTQPFRLAVVQAPGCQWDAACG